MAVVHLSAYIHITMKNSMYNGTIKWFSALKGYGFISSPDSAEDVFVHFSELLVDGFKTIQGNTSVTFDMLQTDKGPIALKVRPESAA